MHLLRSEPPLQLILSIMLGVSLESARSQDPGTSLHPMYRVHDESSVSMQKLMVLQDGETCETEYADKLEGLIREMHTNKDASQENADALENQFKSTMAEHPDTKLCIPASVCDSGSCRPRKIEEILPPQSIPEGGDDDTAAANGSPVVQVVASVWDQKEIPPMHQVHDENTERLHKLMTVPDGGTCSMKFAGMLGNLMVEISDNQEAPPLKASMLDAKFKSTIEEHPETFLCLSNSICDSGKCRPRLAGEADLVTGEPVEEYEEPVVIPDVTGFPEIKPPPVVFEGRSFRKPMGRSAAEGTKEEVAKASESPPATVTEKAPEDKKPEVAPATSPPATSVEPETTKPSAATTPAEKAKEENKSGASPSAPSLIIVAIFASIRFFLL